MLLALIIAGGIYTYLQLQTSLFPEITFPKIKVIADAGLQPVDKMMVMVTRPLELAIKQIPDLQTIRSTTSRGSCEISAFLNWNADINVSQARVESRIAEIRNALPPDVQITVQRMNPSILPVIGYSLESDRLSPIELKQLATFTVKPFLSQVAGVSEVRITGGKSKEYWLQLNMRKMSALSITPDMVNNAMAQSNFIKSNGFLADYRYLYLTITDATVHNKDELEKVVVKNDGKRIVTISDIADVTVNEAVEFIRINANGRDGVLVAVIKQPNANLVSLSAAMEKKAAELRRLLPRDVRLVPYYVQADFVQDSIRSVTDSLFVGLMLAIVVAIIFLRSFRASLSILIAIPVTLCLTLITLYAAGYTLNIMTLGAIAAAIGLIIDDAIVVVEQIHRTHEEHPGESAAALVHKAIDYLFPAMIGSSISTIVIFVPFLLMTGVAGSYFKVMTNTMIIALTCSFFVAWMALPVIYLWFPYKQRASATPRLPRKSRKKWIAFFIFRPYLAVIIVLGLAVASALIFPKLQTGFLPEMDEGSIVLDYTSPPGTSLDETDLELRQVEKIMLAIPEVQAYSRRTGTQMGFFITEPNNGDYLIQLKKNRTRTTEQVIEDIRERVESSQPALRIDFGQVIGDMLGDLMTSVQPIEVKIFGDDQRRLQQLSKQLAGVVAGVNGTADVFDGVVIAGPSIRVDPDYPRLAQYGITPSSLQFQVQTLLEGNVAGSLLEREQYIPIRIIYPGIKSVSNIGSLQVFLPDGKLKPIEQLAHVSIHPGDAEVQRENLQSMGVVTGRLESRDLGSVMKDIQKKVAEEIHLPSGYHVEYGGSFAEQQQSFRELLVILLTSSLLVFSVMLFLFRDIRIAFLVLLIALLGISGSYIALFLTGTALNVGSYTGLIMIVGIVGENAIFTVFQFRAAMRDMNVDESIIYAISTRLRPKLMTALGAIIALMPLALGIGTGAQLHQPLAIAVIGGFVAALPLLLIVLPSGLRLIFHKRAKKVQHSTG